MREIKFRGFSKETNRWYHGFGGFLNEYTKESSYEDDFTLLTESGPVVVVPESVGEYTGLKEMNGKEIYEEDILTSGYENYKVEFFEGAFNLVSSENELIDFAEFIATELVVELTILGNIYENPDLLEVSE